MRIKELYETNPTALGLYNKEQDMLANQLPNKTRTPKLTLKHLNRLKHIRNARRKAREEKLNFLPKLYGNEERLAVKNEQQQNALELIKSEIALEIETAKIDKDQKDHINDMAMRAIERERKA